MAPRFVNPHFLPDSTVSVSRSQLLIEDSTYAEGCAPENSIDGDLIQELSRLIHASLDPEIQPEVHQEKRRRVDVGLGASEPKSPVLFRLVSNTPSLHPLLLEPRPPPPPVTREPDLEDNATQARIRRNQAKAAAVDTSWVLSESKKRATHSPSNFSKCSTVETILPTPNPVIMVLQSDQPHRTTRPPVPPFRLAQRPYVKDGNFPSITIRNVSDCPVIGISPPGPTVCKRRRKRGNKLSQARPPPSFWIPNIAHGGKSLGYAMGYPCSLAALMDTSSLKSSQYCYPRDTMRRAIHIDSFPQ